MLRIPLLGTAVLLSACVYEPPPPPQFAAAGFSTNAAVPLRSGPSDVAATVAMLPEGTPLLPRAMFIGEWQVDTPMGTGWLYTGYIAPRR